MLRLAVDIDMQDWEVHAICLSFWRRLANSYISNFHYFYFSFFILLVHDFSNRKIIEKWSKISDNSPRWPTIEILDVFMICYMMMSSRIHDHNMAAISTPPPCSMLGCWMCHFPSIKRIFYQNMHDQDNRRVFISTWSNIEQGEGVDSM